MRGLVLYSLTILVRSLLEGLRAVPDDVRWSRPALVRLLGMMGRRA